MDLIEDQYLLGKIFVHAADIGNPIQDYNICEEWGQRISHEFNDQIEKEKSKGLKRSMSLNINDITSFYSNEIKYITYICKPYWEILSEEFQCLKPYYDKIVNNLETYNNKLKSCEIDYEFNLIEYST
jgi:hypothetical protein